jgi:hypothetical protein
VVFERSRCTRLKTSELRSAHVLVTYNERALTKYLCAFIISTQYLTLIASIVCQACLFKASSHHFTLHNMPQQTFFITLLSFPLLNYTRSPCFSYGWQGITYSPSELCPHQVSREYVSLFRRHNYKTFYHELWSLITVKTARAETWRLWTSQL